MLGISWFWFYGATFLAQFPGFARDFLGGDEHVVTLLLALFSVGIGVGSLLCERLSGRKVELGLVPFGSIGLTLFAIDLWLASARPARDRRSAASARSSSKPGALARRRRPRADRHVRRLLHRAAVRADPGALGAVASLADHRRQQHPERAVHGGVGAASRSRCSRAGLSIPDLFLVTGTHERGGRALHLQARARVPDALPRLAAHPHGLSRRQARARQHPGRGAVRARLQPRELCRRRRDRRVRAPADPLRDGPPDLRDAGAGLHLPHDAHDPDRAGEGRCGAEGAGVRRGARRRSRNGEIVGIFPEGRLTRSGELNPFRPGIERIVAETPVPVVPMALHGLWGSFFSRFANGQGDATACAGCSRASRSSPVRRSHPSASATKACTQRCSRCAASIGKRRKEGEARWHFG